MFGEKMKKYIKYCVPSLIILLIIMFIYYYNGLYPFYNNGITQVDTDTIYLPTLYKIWDILHHGGNIFYSDIGLGNSIYASLINQGSLFSPLNLLLYFTGRDNLIYFFNIFIMIKICLIGLTCYIYIDNRYNNINYYYKVLFSVLYSFNGFILFNYFNHIWLDLVILFPIIILYLDKLLDDKSQVGYIITLSLSLIISCYFSFFIIVFIFLYSFVNVIIDNKDNKKKIIFKLGLSTIMAFLISSFSTIPFLYQMFHSSRFLTEFNTSLFSNIEMKSLYILLSPFLIIFMIKLIFKYKNDKKEVLKYIILLILYLIPVIFDPINAVLHGGSYWSFPYRYGFVTIFIIMNGGLKYLNSFNKVKNDKISVKDIVIFVTICVLIFFCIKVNLLYRDYIINDDILLKINYDKYILMVKILLIIYMMSLLVFLIKNYLFKYIIICLISLLSIFIFSSWTIYFNKVYVACINAEKVHKSMNIKNDGRYRVGYTGASTYYGYILDVSTLDNWLHIIPDSVVNVYKNMGYYVNGYEVYSVGGTIFSDYLFNIKYIFSHNNYNDDMYELVDNDNNKKLYKYNYNDNYGIVFDNVKNINSSNKFDYQNMIYRNLFNKNEDIINYKTFLSYDDYKIDFKINEPGYLYFYSNYYYLIDYLIIDGVKIPALDNYIWNLGYHDKNVKIEVYTKDGTNINYDVGFIKKSDIINLSSPVTFKNNRYYIDVDDDKYLYLPINNIDGIHVYNNGEEIKTEKYLDNFICIKLNSGSNVINVRYSQPLFKLGVLLSLLGIFMLICNKKIKGNYFVYRISYYLFIAVFIGIVSYVYIYSLIKYFS